MKISQLIESLNEFMETNGDIEIILDVFKGSPDNFKMNQASLLGIKDINNNIVKVMLSNNVYTQEEIRQITKTINKEESK